MRTMTTCGVLAWPSSDGGTNRKLLLTEECQMKNARMIGAGLTVAAIVMAGCASEPSRPYSNGPYDTRQGSYSYGQGVVDRIEVVRKGDSRNIAGTVIGGIAGGLIGHQIGGGSGNTAATIVGAAGGALAGNQVQN